MDPVPLTQPVVPGLQRGLLILAEPELGTFSPNDARTLLTWVDAGNTLLLAGFQQTALHQQLELNLRRSLTDDEPIAVAPELPGPYTDGIERVQVDAHATVDGPGVVPLWSIGDRPGAVLLRHGRGKILVLADPTPLSNQGLRQQDNVMLPRNLALLSARDGKVYFDEYHHGLQSSGGFWGYLGYHRQHLTLLPIALAVAAALWRGMVRLGLAVPAARNTGRRRRLCLGPGPPLRTDRRQPAPGPNAASRLPRVADALPAFAEQGPAGGDAGRLPAA